MIVPISKSCVFENCYPLLQKFLILQHKKTVAKSWQRFPFHLLAHERRTQDLIKQAMILENSSHIAHAKQGYFH